MMGEEMKKENGEQIWKFVLLLVLAGVLFYWTALAMMFLISDYNNWAVSGYAVQERLYDSISMLYASILVLIPAVTLLALVIMALVRYFHPVDKPGRITRFLIQYGLYAAGGFAVIFAVLAALDRNVINRMHQIVETDEVPAALTEHYLSGNLAIASELSVIGAMICFFAWFGNRIRDRQKGTGLLEESIGH